MFSEDDLLPLSALQHLAFCPRQWGLIHLEGVWEESVTTLEGRFLHEQAHAGGTEVRRDIRIARELHLRCLRLGLSGKADVVEFHCIPSSEEQGCTDETHRETILPGVSGVWEPFPVEYKRGRPKSGTCDEVQLCAQAFCLEEMLGVVIPAGAIFYGETRRRHTVEFGTVLREETETLAGKLHELTERGITPHAEYDSRCRGCSLAEACLPGVTGGSRSARKYVARALDTVIRGEEGDDAP